MLVLLADVILLTQVDQVDNWLSSQEEEWVDRLDLLFRQLASQQQFCQTSGYW